MAQCIVCKQPINDGELTVSTPQGVVHVGQCQNHLNEMTVSESDGEQQLQETQLLNG